MNEPVRLVIWDLDDTFWRGTLSEGGIESYAHENHEIVVALAQRGIISSICSKNDAGEVRAILEEKGIWDYFVFPSIDWSPKGARIASLIEAVQLRPETVLFIDDNPNNRAEAEAAAPGIRTAGPEILPTLLAHPLFSGKNDSALSRLQQYKLLERRKADEISASGDNAEFLRGCAINVTIETSIEDHLDRAVELINRTNQLNFTKLRLPDDLALARKQLGDYAAQYFVQAGLIRVTDKYGDYGYCGFYLKHNDNNGNTGRLVHYCFSCRILGMGVEHWLYEKLGRPPIHIDGKILNDLGEHRAVDWIAMNSERAPIIAAGKAISDIRFRGGCDVSALAHYFSLAGNVSFIESNYKKSAFIFARMDSSSHLLNALNCNETMLRDCAAIGLGADDIRSEFLEDIAPGTLLVFSGWGEIDYPLYRHRTLDYRILCPVEILKSVNAEDLPDHEIEEFLTPKNFDPVTREQFHETLTQLRDLHAYDGLLPPEIIAANMREIFRRVPRGAVLAVILPHEFTLENGALLARPRATAYNAAIRAVAAPFDNVFLVDIAEYLRSDSEKQEGADHFHRVVYHRLYETIVDRALQLLARTKAAAAD